MKAKTTITERNRAAEAAQAKPPESPTYKPYAGLHLVKAIMPFLGLGPAPSATDCEDMNLTAYLRAHSLAQFIELAGRGLAAEGSEFPDDSSLSWVVDALQLELQLARLAARILFELCQKLEASPRSPNAA
jgi:hypothetical protein